MLVCLDAAVGARSVDPSGVGRRIRCSDRRASVLVRAALLIDVEGSHLVVVAGFSTLSLLDVAQIFFFHLTFDTFDYFVSVFLELGSASAIVRGCSHPFQLLQVFYDLRVRMILRLWSRLGVGERLLGLLFFDQRILRA